MIEKKLEILENRFKELEGFLSDAKIISNNESYMKFSREHSALLPAMQKYADLKRVNTDLKNLEELKNSTDQELKLIAASEYEEMQAKKTHLEIELKFLLIPPDPNDGKNIIVEIRAGTGGDEAALFAGDLLRMYTRYAEKNGWKTELMDSHSTGLGGFKEVVLNISGKKVWQHFKFERGIHRVQRVPQTEASGRIHTSAVTVAVLAEAEDVDVTVKTEDLRIDTYRASGAGGQYINKTDSAIRITHIPTGLVIACQDERSQLKNRVKAMKILRAKLLEKKELDAEQAMSKDRKSQIGTGDRSEKIRTYNFPQNRITDHRIDFSLYRLTEVLEGEMQELVAKLIADEQEKKLAQ